MNESLVWLSADVLVVPGFEILDAEGDQVSALNAQVAVQGGYLHLAVPGRSDIQMLSAPAVRRVTYEAQCQVSGTSSPAASAAMTTQRSK